MKLINSYKIKQGITLDDIKAEVAKRKLHNSNNGTFVHIDSVYMFWVELVPDIFLQVAFPKDLSKWNSFVYTLVLDEEFMQPYSPFYHAEEHERYVFPYVLKVINKYNMFMDSLNFLEQIE